MSCPARSCTRLVVVCGIEPFAVALYRAPAICANSGMNRLGSGRRDRLWSWLVVAGVDIVRPSLSISAVFMVSQQVRQPSPPECEATRQPHIPGRCLVELVRADATEEPTAP